MIDGRDKQEMLLSTLVLSRLLYGSLIYVMAIEPQRNVETILEPQRVITISTESELKRISTGSVMVIEDLVPVHLLTWDWTERYRRRYKRNTEGVKTEIHE